MRSFGRMFAILLLAMFAASSVASAASTTSMSLRMSATEMDGGHMGDCQTCPPDDGSLVCDQACAIPLLAIAPTARIELPAVHADAVDAGLQDFEGHIQPPQPSPPKSLS